MEGKCRQMTLSEALAAEEQQGPGPRVPLLSPSSLLAAKHRLETQYLIFFFSHADLVVTILSL